MGRVENLSFETLKIAYEKPKKERKRESCGEEENPRGWKWQWTWCDLALADCKSDKVFDVTIVHLLSHAYGGPLFWSIGLMNGEMVSIQFPPPTWEYLVFPGFSGHFAITVVIPSANGGEMVPAAVWLGTLGSCAWPGDWPHVFLLQTKKVMLGRSEVGKAQLLDCHLDNQGSTMPHLECGSQLAIVIGFDFGW